MFKDLYKNANDKIPTQDAYLRVMERVNSESKKTKNPYMKVAALAACFIFTVAMVSVYENNKHSDGLPALISKTPVTETLPTPEIVHEIKPDVTKKPQMITTASPEKAGLVKNAGTPEGAGIAVARFTAQGEIVTSKEYAEYIGKDIEEAVLLPEGFENQSHKEQILVLEDGENFNDKWTFYFEGDESSVFVTTSKKTDDIKNIIDNPEYEKSDILGCKAAVFEEEMQKLAFFENQSIGYTVTAMNISDGDFEALLKSLIK